MEPKRLIVIGGPNGAGKTTFARYYLQEYPADFLSADDLAFKISPDQPESAKIEAGRQFSKKLRESFQSGKSVVIESTLSGRSLQRILGQAKDAGYGSCSTILMPRSRWSHSGRRTISRLQMEKLSAFSWRISSEREEVAKHRYLQTCC